MAIQKYAPEFINGSLSTESKPYEMLLRDVLQKCKNSSVLGLWTHLASRGPSWELSVTNIKNHFEDIGRDKAYDQINYMLRTNLLKRRDFQNKDGQKVGTQYLVLNGNCFDPNSTDKNIVTIMLGDRRVEQYKLHRHCRKPLPDDWEMTMEKAELPFTGNQEVAKQNEDSPLPGLPDLAEPDLANQDHKDNIDIQKTEEKEKERERALSDSSKQKNKKCPKDSSEFVTDEALKLLASKGCDTATVIATFIDKQTGKGVKLVDWHAEFRAWCRNENPGIGKNPAVITDEQRERRNAIHAKREADLEKQSIEAANKQFEEYAKAKEKKRRVNP